MLGNLIKSFLVATLLGAWAAGGASAQFASEPPTDRHFHKRVCTTTPSDGAASCHAEIVTNESGAPLVWRLSPSSASTLGAVPYYAKDLWAAYYGSTTMPGLPAGTTAPTTTPTVAVVDAYGYSSAANDLAKYRQLNNLPPLCTASVTSNCVRFSKLNQSGVAGSYPANNTGWAQESALDIQMVSALCPWCNIVLVEASTASYYNLAQAEVTASRVAGVVAISNSYGGGESGTSLYGASYSPSNTVTNGYTGKLRPNIAVTASSGDSGYAGGTQFPAAVPYVIAVGGSRLSYASGTWSQTAWSGAGSGCSRTYSQMQWQKNKLPSASVCGGRVVSDVSAVADPATGVAVVYGPYLYQFGGTSVSAPIIAGIIGQRNQPISLTFTSGTSASTTYPNIGGGTVATGYGKNLYEQSGYLTDVTSGNNGSCTGSFVCNAGVGYDGPTGMGTPKNLGTANGMSPF